MRTRVTIATIAIGMVLTAVTGPAAQAGPGQVLVSQDVVDRVSSDGFSFESVGSFDLKGVAEPVPLHAVVRERASRSGSAESR